MVEPDAAEPARTGRAVADRVTAAVALVLAAVVLGPMLAPGFPLRYDLVSVPRPVLGDDALGLGDRLPRAIPLDSAIAALATVLPDAWLTQLLGLLTLTLAGWGAGRLVRDLPLPARLVTVLVAVWNPFVMEQLAIGHLPHLFAYAALPWIVGAALRHRAAPGLLAAGFGSLTPGGGVLCVIAAGLAGWAAGGADPGEQPPRTTLNRTTLNRTTLNRAALNRAALNRAALIGGTLVLQLPWLVASLVHPGLSGGDGSGETAGLAAFEVRAETPFGRVVDVLGLGGMWNYTALPSSRHTALAMVSTVLLLGLALLGLVALRQTRSPRKGQPNSGIRVGVAAGAAGLIGYGVALLPVLPGGESLLRTLVEAVPGAGLLRDGHRWLALPALLIAVLAGRAVALAAGRLPAPRQWAACLFAGLLVVASMPDLAGGLDGRLRAWHYPPDWAAVRTTLDRSPDDARVLVLPWQAFRQFRWSGPSAVLDPAPRLLPRQSVVSDALIVSGQKLPEEGPGARTIAGYLDQDGGGTLTDAQLRGLGVGWVLVEHGTPGELPALPPTWRAAYQGSDLTLFRAPGELPAPAPAGTARTAATLAALGLAVGVLLLAALAALLGLGHAITLRRRSADPFSSDTESDDHLQ